MTDYAIEALQAQRTPPTPRAPQASTRRHRLEVPFEVHGEILRGDRSFNLERSRPQWVPGDAVAVHTQTLPDDRRVEDPVTLTVVSVAPQRVCDLTADHARQHGMRLVTDLQRVALELPAETPAAQVNMAARSNQSTVWLTQFARVESDAVRLVRNAGWQAPEGPLRWRPVDAGEAVPADYARALASGVAGDNAAAQEAHRERSRGRGREVRSVGKAKSAVAHRESTRRRRIDVARTANSSVVEPTFRDDLEAMRGWQDVIEGAEPLAIVGLDTEPEAA